MKPLSDMIEDFIKTLMEEDASQIELKRNELAEHFQCAPSQINYVLATRFTPDNGYVIESRRGGGGYIRIVRIRHSSETELLQQVYQRVGTSISLNDALRIIARLREGGVITMDEARLMEAAIAPVSVPLPLAMKDVLCAGTLRSMLLALAKRRREV